MFLDKIDLENLSNKLLYLLAKKSSLFKYCLTVLILCLIFCNWLFLFARPLNSRLISGRAKLKQLNGLKNNCSNCYEECAELSQRIEHLNFKIDKKLNIMGSSSAYLSLGRVMECINCNGVTLIDCSPGKVEKLASDQIMRNDDAIDQSHIAKNGSSRSKMPEFGKKVSFEIILEGTFLSIFNFFKCLSAIKYCLKYKQIFITKNEQGLIGCKLILDILQISKQY